MLFTKISLKKERITIDICDMGSKWTTTKKKDNHYITTIEADPTKGYGFKSGHRYEQIENRFKYESISSGSYEWLQIISDQPLIEGEVTFPMFEDNGMSLYEYETYMNTRKKVEGLPKILKVKCLIQEDYKPWESYRNIDDDIEFFF